MVYASAAERYRSIFGRVFLTVDPMLVASIYLRLMIALNINVCDEAPHTHQMIE